MAESKVVTWGLVSLGGVVAILAVLAIQRQAKIDNRGEAFPPQHVSPAPKQVVLPGDGWDVTVKANALDGARTVTMQKGSFVARCSPRAVAYVLPNLPNLGGQLRTDTDYEQQVRYRIDGNHVVTDRWVVSDSFDSLFLPASTLRKVRSAKSLTFEYHPDYVTPMTQTIDISGLDDEMRKAGCKL